MMQTYILEGVITALSSIAHGGETRGTTQMLRRESVALPSLEIVEVPILSGNGIRGALRDRGMLHMLRTLGYQIDDGSGDFRGLSLAAFYFLFSGGALTSTGDRGLDIDEARKWRQAIPLVALYGGGMGNQLMPG